MEIQPPPIDSFTWDPFNKTTSVASLGREDKALGSSIVDDEHTFSEPDTTMI